MKYIKDGWHDVSVTISVYTENGIILRAIRKSVFWENGDVPVKIYKWDAKLQCAVDALPMKYDTFRKGYREGRYFC